MKKTAGTILKCIAFFMGWAILVALLPVPPSDEPAVWRLWAEVMPLLVVIVCTFVFWLIEKKTVQLHLFDHPLRGVIVGGIAGVLWLAAPVLILLAAGIMHIDGCLSVRLFPVWMLAAFLNVVMQELLVRGYLYRMIRQKHNTAAAVIVTTVLFTACHGGAFEAGLVPVLNVVTMSLLMTAALEYSGSIIAPTTMHFLWNGVGALVLGGVSLAEDYPHLLVTSFSGAPFYPAVLAK